MKVLIAMSGGVDSSVAAYLCRQSGYDCFGATMRLFGDPGSPDADTEDARAVASSLGMPFEAYDLSDRFESEVIGRFVSEYERGYTPNPCIFCNRHLKFGALLDIADSLGCDKLVTGHYSRIEKSGDRYLLKKAADTSKDQSYVLYGLTQHQLSKILLPLGAYTKQQIRDIALDNSLVNAKKRDSQDICFVPDGDYAAFICRYTGRTYPDGNFIDLDGNVLGRHKGIIKYTTGQRKGLGLALPAPMYVCDKRLDTNEVVLCSNEKLFSSTLKVTGFNWIACDCPPAPFRAGVRIRYSQHEQPATVTPTSPDTAVIEFDSPQRAVTPGQSAVVYDGDTVIGGGIITK